MKTLNGEIYCGNWKNDKKDGYGIYDWPTKEHYEGGFLEDQQHGFKIFLKIFLFYFINFLKGFGEFIWSTGARYVGQWKNGLRNDKNAKFFWPNGLKNEL